jgi:hypothetical protein
VGPAPTAAVVHAAVVAVNPAAAAALAPALAAVAPAAAAAVAPATAALALAVVAPADPAATAAVAPAVAASAAAVVVVGAAAAQYDSMVGRTVAYLIIKRQGYGATREPARGDELLSSFRHRWDMAIPAQVEQIQLG